MEWWLSLRPASSRSTRLLLAGVVWTAVGAGLFAAGVRFMLVDPPHWAWIGLVAAVVAGAAKGHFVLSRRAEDNAKRILASGDDRCAGAVFSWESWLLVAVMMAGGIALRRSSMPRAWLGLLYSAVGAGLLLGSAVSWRHWLGHRRAETTG
jgi:hypothetical protein